MQEFCTGVLLWTPETFYNSTYKEIMLAYKGWAKANGVEELEAKNEFMSEEKLKELMERFPDG